MLGQLDLHLFVSQSYASFRVKAVHPDHVVYSTKDKDGKVVEHKIPSNFVLWSTGIAMNPFTSRVSDLLPNQVHKKVRMTSSVTTSSDEFQAIEVDSHLRVKGAPLGTVYAIGDCSTVSA